MDVSAPYEFRKTLILTVDEVRDVSVKGHVSVLCGQDVSKAKQFLPFLQRAGKTEALVEFVASGSRLRLYVPKETCLITLLLSGDCHRLCCNSYSNCDRMLRIHLLYFLFVYLLSHLFIYLINVTTAASCYR